MIDRPIPTHAGELEDIVRGRKPPSTRLESYSATKFLQLVTAQSWHRNLSDAIDIVAVSPGFVPTSGLNRESAWHTRLFMHYVLSWAPFATTIEAGGQAIASALTCDIADQQGLPYVSLPGRKVTLDPRTADEALIRKWAPKDAKSCDDFWQSVHCD